MYGCEYMKRIYFDLIFNKKSNNLLFVPQNFLFMEVVFYFYFC